MVSNSYMIIFILLTSCTKPPTITITITSVTITAQEHGRRTVLHEVGNNFVDISTKLLLNSSDSFFSIHNEDIQNQAQYDTNTYLVKKDFEIVQLLFF